jgi:hypothetical protein
MRHEARNKLKVSAGELIAAPFSQSGAGGIMKIVVALLLSTCLVASAIPAAARDGREAAPGPLAAAMARQAVQLASAAQTPSSGPGAAPARARHPGRKGALIGLGIGAAVGLLVVKSGGCFNGNAEGACALWRLIAAGFAGGGAGVGAII